MLNTEEKLVCRTLDGKTLPFTIGNPLRFPNLAQKLERMEVQQVAIVSVSKDMFSQNLSQEALDLFHKNLLFFVPPSQRQNLTPEELFLFTCLWKHIINPNTEEQYKEYLGVRVEYNVGDNKVETVADESFMQKIREGSARGGIDVGSVSIITQSGQRISLASSVLVKEMMLFLIGNNNHKMHKRPFPISGLFKDLDAVISYLHKFHRISEERLEKTPLVRNNANGHLMTISDFLTLAATSDIFGSNFSLLPKGISSRSVTRKPRRPTPPRTTPQTAVPNPPQMPAQPFAPFGYHHVLPNFGYQYQPVLPMQIQPGPFQQPFPVVQPGVAQYPTGFDHD